jgi:Ca-activated chloride channel family protein
MRLAPVVRVIAVVLAGLTLSARPQFRATTDLVHLPVVVTGRDNQPLRGLTAENFDVREDGRPQPLSFLIEGAVGASLPLHLGLLLDTSESMMGDLADAATAAIQFVNTLEESLDVTLVDFDTSVRVGRFSPPSYPHLFERIRARKASGMTALYDALAEYLSDATSRDGQHVLVVFTDGGDSSSSMSFGKLDQLLRLSSNVLVYVIGYLEHQSSSERANQQMRLMLMARETGADAYFPGSAKEIRDIYARILNELEARYTVGYVPSNRAADGRFRKLEVKVTRPDLKGVKVRTRPGYYAPRQ